MNCKDYEKIEEKNRFASLTPNEKKELDEHIALCPKCRAEYELYKLCQGEFDLVPDAPEPLYLREKISDAIEKKYSGERSVFDFIFGFGHNPVKAGFAVGLGLLAFAVLAGNLFSMTVKKPVKTENFYSSTQVSSYSNQFYQKM